MVKAESAASTATRVGLIAEPKSPGKAASRKRIRTAKPAALEAVERKPVTGVGAPS
jgi:hypothetical protein